MKKRLTILLGVMVAITLIMMALDTKAQLLEAIHLMNGEIRMNHLLEEQVLLLIKHVTK